MLPQADLNTFAATRQLLKTGGVNLRSWFCGDLTKTSEIERLVDGVHLLGVKTVSGSATHELLDSIDAACGNAGFQFGIHNHYFANRKFLYESPDNVLAALNAHPCRYQLHIRPRLSVPVALESGLMSARSPIPTTAVIAERAFQAVEETPAVSAVLL